MEKNLIVKSSEKNKEKLEIPKPLAPPINIQVIYANNPNRTFGGGGLLEDVTLRGWEDLNYGAEHYLNPSTGIMTLQHPKIIFWDINLKLKYQVENNLLGAFISSDFELLLKAKSSPVDTIIKSSNFPKKPTFIGIDLVENSATVTIDTTVGPGKYYFAIRGPTFVNGTVFVYRGSELRVFGRDR